MTTSTPTPADALITAMHEPERKNLLDLIRNTLRLTLLCMTWDDSCYLTSAKAIAAFSPKPQASIFICD